MGKIIRNGINYGGTYDSATSVNYDNTNSGLNARTVQEGIDELHGNVDALSDSLAQYRKDNISTIVTSTYCTIGSCAYHNIGEIIILTLNITTNSEVPAGSILLDNIPLRPYMNFSYCIDVIQ